MSSRSRRLAAIHKLEKILLSQNSQESINNWDNFGSFVGSVEGKEGVFTPYPYQLIVRELFSGVIWVGKTRQLGFTELCLWECVWRAVSEPFFTGVIFCRSGDDVSLLTRRARVTLFSLQITTVTDSLSIIEFRNGSKIIFKNCSQLGTRSIPAVDFLMFDEAAFVRNMDIIYRASLPSTSSAKSPVILVVSTPQYGSWFNGVMLNNNPGIDVIETSDKLVSGEIPGGVYHWKDNDGITKILLSHRCHPKYSKIDDYVTYRAKIEGISYEEAKQEYGLGWTCGASEAVFNSIIVRNCATGNYEKEYDKNSRYLIGVDTATTGQDYFVAVVLKLTDEDKLTVVSLYRKKSETFDYNLYKVSELINLYKPAQVGIEVTGGVGQVALEKLSKEHSDIAFKSIRTTGDSKPAMIGKLQIYLEQTKLEYPEKSPIVEELLSFQRHGTKLEASSGHNDDCVMALAFALAIHDPNKKLNLSKDTESINIWSRFIND